MPTEQLLSAIARSDSAELSEMIHAIIRRYGELNPDWEISFLTLPKNDESERSRILSTAFDMLKKK